MQKEVNEIAQKQADKTIISDDVVQEVVKHKRPKRSENYQIKAAPGEHSKYLKHSLRMWNWTRPDMTSLEAVENRIQEYFNICAEDDIKPSVEGLAVAFDVDRKQLWRWANGVQSTIDCDISHTIKKAYTVLNLQMVDYMQNGQINPVSGIFLMKNNMAYTDSTEVIVTPNSPLGTESSAEEAQKRLEADLPIEGEFTTE